MIPLFIAFFALLTFFRPLSSMFLDLVPVRSIPFSLDLVPVHSLPFTLSLGLDAAGARELLAARLEDVVSPPAHYNVPPIARFQQMVERGRRENHKQASR